MTTSDERDERIAAVEARLQAAWKAFKAASDELANLRADDEFTKFDDLGWSSRTRARVRDLLPEGATIIDLAVLSETKLLETFGLGPKSIREVAQNLEHYDLRLGMERSEARARARAARMK